MEKIDYMLKSGNILRLVPDENPDSPQEHLEDWFLVYEHRNFTVTFKDGNSRITARQVFTYLESQKEDDITDRSDLFDDFYIFPVDAYIHSGVHLSLANTKNYPDRRWDVSTSGFVLHRKVLDTEDPKAPEVSEKVARTNAAALLVMWNAYNSGDIYGFKLINPVTCSECGHVEEEELDSCWGFYGDNPEENGMLENLNEDRIKYKIDK